MPAVVLTVVACLATVASAAAALIGIWHATRSLRVGAELDAFLVLTARFEQIISELPERFTKDWDEATDADLSIRQRYLNLCSKSST